MLRSSPGVIGSVSVVIMLLAAPTSMLAGDPVQPVGFKQAGIVKAWKLYATA